ncbi:MAG: UMP kinase [Christensenellaceae bacterium]
MIKPVYKRVLLKLSGEALAGPKGMGYDDNVISTVVKQIKDAVSVGVEVAIVVGGGNFWRGRQGNYMERTTADYMGMLATAMNALALQDALEHVGVDTRVQTALGIDRIGEPYNRRKAHSYLTQKKVVIFACGTGHPYFSTDTAAALRAVEISADVILLAKNVDGIYDSDPKTNKNARKFDNISYIDFISKGLKAMDTTAVTICMENGMPILAFGFEDNSIMKVLSGESLGTLIK